MKIKAIGGGVVAFGADKGVSFAIEVPLAKLSGGFRYPFGLETVATCGYVHVDGDGNRNEMRSYEAARRLLDQYGGRLEDLVAFTHREFWLSAGRTPPTAEKFAAKVQTFADEAPTDTIRGLSDWLEARLMLKNRALLSVERLFTLPVPKLYWDLTPHHLHAGADGVVSKLRKSRGSWEITIRTILGTECTAQGRIGAFVPTVVKGTPVSKGQELFEFAALPSIAKSLRSTAIEDLISRQLMGPGVSVDKADMVRFECQLCRHKVPEVPRNRLLADCPSCGGSAKHGHYIPAVLLDGPAVKLDNPILENEIKDYPPFRNALDRVVQGLRHASR